MVEVPALALHAAAVAPLVDLFSVGTNDLTQYTLAAERGNAAVAALADPLDPAVLRLVASVTAAAGDRARVAVCGELAAEPSAVALLAGLGVHELSVGPAAIPSVKDAVRATTLSTARQLAEHALTLDSAAEVRALLQRSA
jgi:phosphocarrier protein FPr